MPTLIAMRLGLLMTGERETRMSRMSRMLWG